MKKMIACVLAVMMAFAAVPALAVSTLEISVWYEELPNDTVIIPNVHEVLCDVENTEFTYVIDAGTEITIQRAIGSVEITDGNENVIFSTESGITSKLVTVTYETAVRQDRNEDVWKDEVSPIRDFPYIKAGTVIQFHSPGSYFVKLTSGYESMEERIEIQKASTAWRSTPVMGFQVGEASNVEIPARYTSSKVLINGAEVAFEAYNINDNNYFKLRDLAMAFTETDKQFEVTWDADAHVIGLTSQKPYTAVGGELVTGDGADKTCLPYKDGIVLNGNSVDVQAYNINGNNYFKLRDICKLFDIGVIWDEETNTISLDTSVGYVDEN